MSDKKPIVEKQKVICLATLVFSCLTSVLLVTQCIMFYRVLRLEGEMKALRNARTGFPDSPTLHLRQQRSLNGAKNLTEPNEDLNRDRGASYRNTSSPGVCKLCSTICPRTSSHLRKQIPTEEASSKTISCVVGLPGAMGPPGPRGPPGGIGPTGPQGPPGNAKNSLAPPHFIRKLPRVATVNEGQNLSLLCDVSGHPQPEVTWHRNGQTLNVVANQRWLNMTNVRYEDTGMYVCTARNLLSTIQASVKLLVAAKPRFLRRFPAQHIAYLGKTTTLQCAVGGHPKPVITWIRMPPLRPGKRHVIEGNYLTIHKTNRNDGGVYACHVTSKFGVIYDGLLLTIKKTVAPEILHIPNKVIVRGHNISAIAACTATGDPLPQVTWYRGDDVTPSRRHVKNKEVTAELRFENFTPENEGTYKCVARNEFNVSVERTTTIVLLHCGDPGTPTNGTKIGSKYWFGDMVIFSCDEGHRLKHSNIRVCLTNGNWSGTQPECVPVGKECTEHLWLRESSRRMSSSGSGNCDGDLSPGWYRFSEAAGLHMLTSCTEQSRCGTYYPGWLVGPHPTTEEGQASRKVCFASGGTGSYRDQHDCCSFSKNITVRNCGDFYVYKLGPVPRCDARYCGAN